MIFFKFGIVVNIIRLVLISPRYDVFIHIPRK